MEKPMDAYRLRVRRATFEKIARHLKGENENFCFLLCSKAACADGTIYIAKDLLLPGTEDIARASPVAVESTGHFLNRVYTRALQGFHPIDIHVHPWRNGAQFSSLDRQNFLE